MTRYCKDVKINLDNDIPRISLINQDYNDGYYKMAIHDGYCVIIEIKNDRLIFASSQFIIINDGEKLQFLLFD